MVANSNQRLGQKLIIGSGYSYFSLLVNKGITTISSVFLARFLGPTNLGMISIINYLLLLLLFFTGLGIPTASVKLISEVREREPEKVGEFITVGFVFNLVIIIFVSSLYFFFSSGIANQIYHEARLAPLIRISAVALFFFSLNQYGNSVIQAFAEFKRLSFLLIFNSVFGLFTLLFFTKLFGLTGPVISQSLTSIATFFLLLRVIKHLGIMSLLSSQWKGLRRVIRERGYFHKLFSLALPVFLSGLVMTPVLTALTTLLSRLSGFTAVGFFNIAYSLTQVILFVPTAVGTPFLPLVMKIGADDSRRLTDFLMKTIYGVVIIVAVLSFLMSFFSYEIINLFYGARYSPEQNILILLTVATFLSSFGYVVGYYLLAVGKMWFATFLNLLWCIFIMTPAFHLIKSFGFRLSCRLYSLDRASHLLS